MIVKSAIIRGHIGALELVVAKIRTYFYFYIYSILLFPSFLFWVINRYCLSRNA